MLRTAREANMKNTPDNSSSEEILAILRNLESRIASIESRLGMTLPQDEVSPPGTVSIENEEREQDELELKVGQNWFAKVGIVVLAIGIVFLLTYPYQSLPAIAPSAIGYLLTIIILGVSRYWRDTYQQISRYLLGSGLLLLYFTTLRLSHFSADPVITSAAIEVALLIIVVSVNLAVSIRKQSVYLFGFNLTLAFITALVPSQSIATYAIAAASALAAVYFSLRFGWTRIPLLAIPLCYTAHLVHAFNIPVFDHGTQARGNPEIQILFILLYGAIFGAGTLMHTKKQGESAVMIGTSVLNGFALFGLAAILGFTTFRADFALWEILVSAACLTFAIVFWIREKCRYTTFIYAMLGYSSLSLAIVDRFVFPDLFVWLCWQSVLVLTTAVWFRSRFIVVANFCIYVLVLIAYLAVAGTVSAISLSFGVVALLSARILNWQKHRLELKTEMMRNAYLACALFVLPYGLYRSMPAGYVSISWLGLAFFYYVASRILHNNRKYRWMALLTTLLTIVHAFLVDLTGVNPTFRILSFLVLGSALLGISMFYSRKKIAR
jgi:uncharacterized membrane protein